MNAERSCVVEEEKKSVLEQAECLRRPQVEPSLRVDAEGMEVAALLASHQCELRTWLPLCDAEVSGGTDAWYVEPLRPRLQRIHQLRLGASLALAERASLHRRWKWTAGEVKVFAIGILPYVQRGFAK